MIFLNPIYAPFVALVGISLIMLCERIEYFTCDLVVEISDIKKGYVSIVLPNGICDKEVRIPLTSKLVSSLTNDCRAKIRCTKHWFRKGINIRLLELV
ncbi:MAG: hypothetical protein V4576_02910 [Patescibacteria group bacterium]